jgi:hypothetical protein
MPVRKQVLICRSCSLKFDRDDMVKRSGNNHFCKPCNTHVGQPYKKGVQPHKTNEYVINGDCCEVVLTGGHTMIIDTADIPLINKYRCIYEKSNGYAYALVRDTRKKVAVHRLIVNTPIGMLTDHINRNRTDNRRSNLRRCTTEENSWNNSRIPSKITGYIGVEKTRCISKPWRAQIESKGKHIPLGYYCTAIEAAIAYNKASIELRGEFARINQIDTNHIEL